ncbi:MAG: DUF1592 domain-containing protein [Planctomycetota bacterium]|nr:DUF1592 domain-containing protein [Planctomycetota bacterium]
MNTPKHLALPAFAVLLCGLTIGQEVPTDPQQLKAASTMYQREIQPLLEKHCIDCHGPELQKAMLRLDLLDPTFAGPAAETWQDVLNKLSIGEMPPEDRPIDTDSRRKLVSWLRAGLDRVARERKGSRNQTVLRRLTRYEYNNTLRDLLGIDLDFARDLPPEPLSADGFKNNGAALGISPLQMEYYLKAARLAMDKAIVEGPAPQVHKHRFEKSSSGTARRNEFVTGNRLPPQGRFIGKMLEYPREGEFVVRVKAGASIPEGMGVPTMSLALGLRADIRSPSKTLGEADVRNTEAEKQLYEFRGRIEEFPLPGHNPKFPGVTITLTNIYDDGLKTPKPGKFKGIALSAEQKKLAAAATKKNTPTLPIGEIRRVKGNAAVTSFVRSSGKLQRKIEELRLLSPEHKNQTDLAYRLYDVQQAFDQEFELIEKVSKTLNEDPSAFLSRFLSSNEALLADRQKVVDRFRAITPIDRKTKQLVGAEAGPPRATIVIDYLEFEGPLYKSWPPEHHTRLLPPSNASERDRAEQAIRAFMTRAYRRPITDGDVFPVMSVYDEIRPESPSFEEAMRESLTMVLISPEFLYLIEPTDDKPRPLSQHELASRLSYFLWSTMPDDRLMALANSGQLRAPAVMAEQVRAMIADARSQNFVEHFTNQWLDLGGLDRVAINPNYYPAFDDRLKPMMKRETQAFFGEVLRKNLSALNLIDSDFAMLNEPLAKHYGVSNEDGSPVGSAFERVALTPTSKRGGLLTQGSFLMINSNGEDSHPIRRAVWVLDRLLDDPPAPPPPDVPELDAEQPDLATLPLKKQLELHRTKEACNDCHRGIDPWGIAFESFDAVGLRRESVLRRIGKKSVMGPLDDRAILPNKTEIDGVEGLKKYLLHNERDRFSRALVSKLLAYGMGRSLVLEDRSTIESLVRTFKKNNFCLSDLVVAITQSEAFQNK